MPKLVDFDTLRPMEEISITLFGPPGLQIDGRPVELKSRKGWALIAYLALMPNPVPREIAATLLWPEQDASGGRRNLRRLLYTLNQSELAAVIEANAEELALAPKGSIDVLNFLNSIEGSDWAGAISAYGGDLLEGVKIGDSNPFESWMTEQREQLRQQMLQALTALADQQLAQDDYLAVEATLRQQLSLDSWNELIWRRLMTLLAEKGRRAQALSTYNDCQQLLKKELGVKPSDETVLYTKRSEMAISRAMATRAVTMRPHPRSRSPTRPPAKS